MSAAVSAPSGNAVPSWDIGRGMYELNEMKGDAFAYAEHKLSCLWADAVAKLESTSEGGVHAEAAANPRPVYPPAPEYHSALFLSHAEPSPASSGQAADPAPALAQALQVELPKPREPSSDPNLIMPPFTNCETAALYATTFVSLGTYRASSEAARHALDKGKPLITTVIKHSIPVLAAGAAVYGLGMLICKGVDAKP